MFSLLLFYTITLSVETATEDPAMQISNGSHYFKQIKNLCEDIKSLPTA